MDDAEALTAHYALHSNAEVVHIQPGEDYPIVTSKNGCRKVVVRGHTIMVQNPDKPSKYGTMARKGARISWIMGHPNWALIVEDRIEKRNTALNSEAVRKMKAAAVVSHQSGAITLPPSANGNGATTTTTTTTTTTGDGMQQHQQGGGSMNGGNGLMGPPPDPPARTMSGLEGLGADQSPLLPIATGPVPSGPGYPAPSDSGVSLVSSSRKRRRESSLSSVGSAGGSSVSSKMSSIGSGYSTSASGSSAGPAGRRMTRSATAQLRKQDIVHATGGTGMTAVLERAHLGPSGHSTPTPALGFVPPQPSIHDEEGHTDEEPGNDGQESDDASIYGTYRRPGLRLEAGINDDDDGDGLRAKRRRVSGAPVDQDEDRQPGVVTEATLEPAPMSLATLAPDMGTLPTDDNPVIAGALVARPAGGDGHVDLSSVLPAGMSEHGLTEDEREYWTLQAKLLSVRERMGGQAAGRVDGLAKAASAMRDWHIDGEELVIGEVLGEGGFGTVSRGTWRGNTVAVKEVRNANQMTPKALEQFHREISLLSRLRHPNILLFLGSCTSRPPSLYLVMEYMSKGSLHELIHRDGMTRDLGWLWKFARDIAAGLNHLHLCKPKVIHRDLKPANLLVDEGFNIKLADFGISRESTNTATATAPIGTIAYMAPEIVMSNSVSEKVDVYAFGIVLWEMFTCTMPFKGKAPMQVAYAVCNQGMRPPIPPQMPVELSSLIQECWAPDPETRPTFSGVLTYLERMAPSGVALPPKGPTVAATHRQTRSVDPTLPA